MELFKVVWNWEFSPTAPGLWASVYIGALWYVAAANSVSLWSWMNILTKNATPIPLLVRACILGLCLALLHGVLAPIVQIYQPLTVRNFIGATSLSIIAFFLATGRFSVAVKINHKPLVQIEVVDGEKTEEGKTN